MYRITDWTCEYIHLGVHRRRVSLPFSPPFISICFWLRLIGVLLALYIKKEGLSVRLQLDKPPIPHRSLPERKQASIPQSCLSLHIQTAEASSHVSRENIRNHSSAGNPLLGVPSWVVDGKHENKMMRHARKSGIIIVGYILTAPNQYSYSEVEISCGLSF